MKKIIVCIATALLAAVCAFGAACGKNSSFTAPNFGDFGKVVYQNAFVCETENYVLFINGAGSSTADNSYGTPVKGSLMAIKKDDFTSGKYTEAKIIVPKLFAATDYTAGIYVSGDYVYYGTPSTDKNSSGDIANDEIKFMKSKIDGTEKPKELFEYSALSVSYRIAGTENGVVIVYYDTEDTALKVYSENTGKTEVIVKTDAETNDGANSEYLSLDSYMFVDGENSDDYAVIYSVTVYNEKYYEKKAEQEDYSRTTASHNYVYAYKAGTAKADGETVLGTKVLDGKTSDVKYTLKLVKDGYFFYTETDVNSKETVKGVKIVDIASADKHETVKNTDLVADTTYISSLTEAYALSKESDDDTAASVYKHTLTGKATENDEKVILETEGLSSILFKNGDYLYFYNSDNNIVRIELSKADANVERVSLGSANTSWYKPVVLTIGEKPYMLYSDATTIGSSYVYVADLSKEAIPEDAEDEDNDVYYIDGVTLLGEMTAEDTANAVAAAVGEIGSILELTEDENGTLICDAYKEAKEVYDKLSDEAKAYVSDSNLETLENCEKAISLANKYNALSKVGKYDKMSEDEKTAFKTAFEAAKAERAALIDEGVYETVRDMLSDQYKYYYQEAAKKFA